jgi:hypothetical protein
MFPPPFELIECIDLFNILNAEINGLARISDTNYLYLLGLFASENYSFDYFCRIFFLKIVDHAKNMTKVI